MKLFLQPPFFSGCTYSNLFWGLCVDVLCTLTATQFSWGFGSWALFIWVCCSSSLITEFPWCLESLILASGYTCPCCCLLLVLCWLVLPGGVILLEPCVCRRWEKGMLQNRATAREVFKWSSTFQIKGVTPCDSISFTFQRVIQRLSASQTSRVKHISLFLKKKTRVLLAYWTWVM